MADLLGWLLRVSPQNIPPFFRADRRAPCEYSPGVNKLQIKNVKACKHPSHGSLTTPPCSGKPITQAVPAADYKKGREQLQKHLRAFPRALPECALGAEGSRKGRRADERQGRDGKRSNSDPKRTSSIPNRPPRLSELPLSLRSTGVAPEGGRSSLHSSAWRSVLEAREISKEAVGPCSCRRTTCFWLPHLGCLIF